MRALAHAAWIACLLFATGDVRPGIAQSGIPPIREMLDRYPSRMTDLSFLTSERAFEQFREQFIREATAWMRAGDAISARRRELAAASFGLEVAHAGFDVAWS